MQTIRSYRSYYRLSAGRRVSVSLLALALMEKSVPVHLVAHGLVEQRNNKTEAVELFDSGEGRYAYAPSSIHDGEHESVFYCANKEPYHIKDYIYLKE